MHPAETAGDRAGRLAASEDRAHGRADSATPVLTASRLAVAWVTEHARIADQTGASRVAYIHAYLAAYYHELRESA